MNPSAKKISFVFLIGLLSGIVSSIIPHNFPTSINTLILGPLIPFYLAYLLISTRVWNEKITIFKLVGTPALFLLGHGIAVFTTISTFFTRLHVFSTIIAGVITTIFILFGTVRMQELRKRYRKAIIVILIGGILGLSFWTPAIFNLEILFNGFYFLYIIGQTGILLALHLFKMKR